MDELEFYNQQFEKYQRYDRQRSGDRVLDLEKAEHYFEHLVNSYSDPEGTLVDLGCGDGYFTSKLSRLNANVIGIEPSSLIFAANELLENDKTENLRFLQEDAYQLSLDDESVELVISRRGPDPAEEILRVLKDNGSFIYITIGEMDASSLKEVVGRGQHFRSAEKVSGALKEKFLEAGFSDVICKEFHYDEEYSSSEKLKAFLHQVPIFDEFSESDYPSVDGYCAKYKADNIKLNRHRVVLLAKK